MSLTTRFSFLTAAAVAVLVALPAQAQAQTDARADVQFPADVQVPADVQFPADAQVPADVQDPADPSAPAASAAVPLAEAVDALPVADESREGYDRSLFPHWVDADRDGCNTRAEVLLEEAVVAPEVGERCRISGGEWFSYYDGATVTEARGLDIDHMVPLAEAWDSGASQWTTTRRRDYANDLGEPVALVAVTAHQNRSKSDKDPSEWMPAAAEVHCRYAAEWTTVKTRWGLSVDTAERDALLALAQDCPDEVVETEPAP